MVFRIYLTSQLISLLVYLGAEHWRGIQSCLGGRLKRLTDSKGFSYLKADHSRAVCSVGSRVCNSYHPCFDHPTQYSPSDAERSIRKWSAQGSVLRNFQYVLLLKSVFKCLLYWYPRYPWTIASNADANYHLARKLGVVFIQCLERSSTLYWGSAFSTTSVRSGNV